MQDYLYSQGLVKSKYCSQSLKICTYTLACFAVSKFIAADWRLRCRLKLA